MLFLCSCLAAVPSSRPAGAQARRAQGPSRLAVAMTLRLTPVFPGHALTGPSAARRSSTSGRWCIGLGVLEGAPVMENRPGDAGEFVGERNRQHVVVKPFLGCFDPRPEPIALPLLPQLDQDDPRRLHEEGAQIAIAALGYASENRAVPGRYLLRHQAEPGAEVAALREPIAGADGSHHRARDDRPDARHRHQPFAGLILTRERFDLAGQAFDAFVEPAPVACQVLDDPQHTG